MRPVAKAEEGKESSLVLAAVKSGSSHASRDSIRGAA